MTNELREILNAEIREQAKRFKQYPGRENRDRLAELIRMARDCRAYDALGEINDSIKGNLDKAMQRIGPEVFVNYYKVSNEMIDVHAVKLSDKTA